MTKQDETLEQAAIRYASQKIETRYPKDAAEDFKAGASWREQQAASGFEDYEKEYWDREAIGGKTYREWTQQNHVEMATSYQRRAWQASALHSAKLLAEKDAEIEKAKELIKEMRDTLNFYAGGKLEHDKEYQATGFYEYLYGKLARGLMFNNAEKIKALLGEE